MYPILMCAFVCDIVSPCFLHQRLGKKPADWVVSSVFSWFELPLVPFLCSMDPGGEKSVRPSGTNITSWLCFISSQHFVMRPWQNARQTMSLWLCPIMGRSSKVQCFTTSPSMQPWLLTAPSKPSKPTNPHESQSHPFFGLNPKKVRPVIRKSTRF